MRRVTIASIALLLAGMPRVSHGQVGGEPEKPLKSFTSEGYLIQDGGNELSGNLRSMIAGTLRPTLPHWPKGSEAPASGIQISSEGEKLGPAQLIHLVVYVHSSEMEPSEAEMRQLWKVARAKLEAELQRVASMAGEAQRQQLQEELAITRAKRDTLGAEMAKATEELSLRRAESAGMEGSNLAELIAKSVSDQRGLQIEDAGVRARREAIEKQIDQLRVKADASADKDPVLSELKKLADVRRQQVKAVQALHDVGRNGGTEFEVAEAEGQLALALVELSKAKHEAAERAGGGQLRAWNDELSKLLIEAAEVAGQRKEIEQVIAELREQVRDSARASAASSNLQHELQTLDRRRHEEDAKFSNLERERANLSSSPVTLRPLMASEDAEVEGKSE